MNKYCKELVVAWGECDPFGLVYFPRMLEWFNDTEHEMFSAMGLPIRNMIERDRTTFVMGEIHFRFIGPAAYGERIMSTMTLDRIGKSTLHWDCRAVNAETGAAITEGRAVRVYANLMDNGSLKSARIPAAMRKILSSPGKLDATAKDKGGGCSA